MSSELSPSPLAPARFPDLPAVAGVRLATSATGLRYKGRDDLLICEVIEGTTVAGTLTTSKTCSAAVDWCKKALVGGAARGLIVNSGNANAFTGKAGEQVVETCVSAVADQLACRPSRVFCASTGVIGQQLPAEAIVSHVGSAWARMEDSNADLWHKAAKAIMTTDTFAKGAGQTVKIGDADVHIAGIAKGSGMIAPDMATMLAFIFTDAALPAPLLQELFSPAVARSFNAITVDSDTSTSDTALLMATAAAPGQPSIASAEDPLLDDFRQALDAVLLDLAQQIVRDGEGATKFISITVTGAETDIAARRIGLSIANSPLVKTAIAGEDANWGRIVMAVGKSGEMADRDKLAIEIGGYAVARAGMAVDGFDETPVAAHMKNQEIDISVDVGIADGRATVWTCDLTHGYISINADYRS
ncbi:MAG: bifunctional glutamate N-acetyltransferase/amino-acid acetyltransferase ArgJ [Rhodospirillales bacterium]|nr:bifunctional glutamate N-acetyltransferase/amino-acid acetyltransferase ArgJ [Rhodospirillales bacterium]